MKRTALICRLSTFIAFIFSSISHAQTTTSEQRSEPDAAFTKVSTEFIPLLVSYENAIEPNQAYITTSMQSEDSLTAEREFANAVTCSGLILRLTKMPNFNRIDKPSVNNLRVFGISYERKLGRHITIGAGYYLWKQFAPWFNDVSVYAQPYIPAGRVQGFVQTLNSYKMGDLFGKYFLNFGRHQVEGGLGISYTWGDNTVLDTIYVYRLHDVVISHHESAKYAGIIALIGYHYYFLHNRCSIGYEINWRNYFGIYSPFLQNGLTVRFRF